MKALVSVVVPVYNTAPWLDRCIGSIAAQTYDALEILLVDDGSTDASPALCRRWAENDSRIRVIRKENAGLGMARNTGMDLASGRYIFFLDSDDYVEAHLVETCLRCAAETGAAAVLYGAVREGMGRCRPDRITVPRRIFSGEAVAGELLPCLYTYGFGLGVSAWGKMFDLTFLRQQGLRFPSERDMISEDGWFMLMLFSRAERAAVVPEPLYHYCLRRGSLTRQYRPDRPERCHGFLEECRRYIREAGLPRQVEFAVAARYHGMLLGAMMELPESPLSRREKRKRLQEIFDNPVLCSTLDPRILALDAPLPRLLWLCLRRGWQPAALVLLQLNRLRKRRRP